jgi:hypothetical protein
MRLYPTGLFFSRRPGESHKKVIVEPERRKKAKDVLPWRPGLIG